MLCERARGWASRALDGELSEFERALMTTHLEGCAECARFADELQGFTAELREAGFEPLPRPVELPIRRGFARTLQLGAAAAVLAVAVGLGGLLASSPAPTGNHSPVAQLSATSDGDSDELLRAVQRQSLTPLPPRGHRGLKFLDISA